MHPRDMLTATVNKQIAAGSPVFVNMSQNEGRFEVSAAWMKACGKGEAAKVFPCKQIYIKGGLTFADLDDNGHTWTVIADWRGRFVN
jgi:hypothetical protein